MSYESELAAKKGELEKLIEYHEQHGALFSALAAAMTAKLNIIRLSACEKDLTIAFTGDKHALAAAFGILRRAGFERPASPPTENLPIWTGFFHHPCGAAVYLTFTSTVCRRVQVGTKTKEVPVYETVCGETEL